jgi:hypothetical protein
MEGRRRDAVLDRPVDGAGRDIGIIVVHAEDDAAVDMIPRPCSRSVTAL